LVNFAFLSLHEHPHTRSPGGDNVTLWPILSKGKRRPKQLKASLELVIQTVDEQLIAVLYWDCYRLGLSDFFAPCFAKSSLFGLQRVQDSPFLWAVMQHL